MSFIERKIALQITLGQGASFDPSGSNVVNLEKHRISVSINKTIGGAGFGEARIRVYGLVPSILNKLSSLNSAIATAQGNRLAVMAGDDRNGMALVFTGNIILAQADMSTQPETALSLLAVGSGLQATQNIAPQSYPGGADAAVILQNLASLAGLNFVNYGASKIISTSYTWGSARKQIEDVIRAAGFHGAIDNGALIIWPADGVRGGQVPLVSSATGMVGYPTYWASEKGGGIAVTTVFNQQLRTGAAVKVESGLNVANGTWGIYELAHDIESLVPGGQWFSHFKANSYGR